MAFGIVGVDFYGFHPGKFASPMDLMGNPQNKPKPFDKLNKKKTGYLPYIGDEILPNYMGIISQTMT